VTRLAWLRVVTGEHGLRSVRGAGMAPGGQVHFLQRKSRFVKCGRSAALAVQRGRREGTVGS